MRLRLLWPILFGAVGVTILVALGVWQTQRLEWKEGLIAEIEARMAADPVPLQAQGVVSRDDDYLLRVRAVGTLGGDEIHVLTSIKGRGPGFRVIAPMTLADGRRALIDLGYVPETRKDDARVPPDRTDAPVEIVGLLHWPNEVDGFTPDPDRAKNIWFARDVPAMAEALGTEPILVVAASHPLGDYPLPRPPGVDLPNRHLEYALTWFGLAAVWAVMTVLLVRRLARRAPGTG